MAFTKSARILESDLMAATVPVGHDVPIETKQLIQRKALDTSTPWSQAIGIGALAGGAAGYLTGKYKLLGAVGGRRAEALKGLGVGALMGGAVRLLDDAEISYAKTTSKHFDNGIETTPSDTRKAGVYSVIKTLSNLGQKLVPSQK